MQTRKSVLDFKRRTQGRRHQKSKSVTSMEPDGKYKISRSEQSLWWLMNLTSFGMNLISRDIQLSFSSCVGYNYRPKRSFGQGNIFTSVCHSFCSQGGVLQIFGGGILGGFLQIFGGGNFFWGGPSNFGGGVLLRNTVILLECILVTSMFGQKQALNQKGNSIYPGFEPHQCLFASM